MVIAFPIFNILIDSAEVIAKIPKPNMKILRFGGFVGISQANLNKLQGIQNSVVRVIKQTNTSQYQHITPTLKNYTGFQSIKHIIDYKLCRLT